MQDCETVKLWTSLLAIVLLVYRIRVHELTGNTFHIKLFDKLAF